MIALQRVKACPRPIGSVCVWQFPFCCCSCFGLIAINPPKHTNPCSCILSRPPDLHRAAYTTHTTISQNTLLNMLDILWPTQILAYRVFVCNFLVTISPNVRPPHSAHDVKLCKYKNWRKTNSLKKRKKRKIKWWKNCWWVFSRAACLLVQSVDSGACVRRADAAIKH